MKYKYVQDARFVPSSPALSRLEALAAKKGDAANRTPVNVIETHEQISLIGKHFLLK